MLSEALVSPLSQLLDRRIGGSGMRRLDMTQAVEAKRREPPPTPPL